MHAIIFFNTFEFFPNLITFFKLQFPNKRGCFSNCLDLETGKSKDPNNFGLGYEILLQKYVQNS